MQSKIELNHLKLVIARHLVGITLVSMVNPYLMSDYKNWQFAWLGGLIFCVGFGALISALAALFFTKTQSRHWLSNAIKVSWVTAALVLFGSWGDLQKPKPKPAKQLHSTNSIEPKFYQGEIITATPPGFVPFNGELDKVSPTPPGFVPFTGELDKP